MRNPRQILWTFLILVVAAGAWYAKRPKPVTPVLRQAAGSGRVTEENHYSPAENLEQFDRAEIDAARQSLDIAMYAFTDRYLAEAILQAAQRGVQVRLYRDHGQYDDEQGRRDSTTAMLQGQANIHIRVKHPRELMHLKAFCVDGTVLRDGSANWSPSGMKRQDNNAHFTTDPRQVQVFRQTFESMWSRENDVVQ